jgi:hypothetical protein
MDNYGEIKLMKNISSDTSNGIRFNGGARIFS